MLGSVCVGGWVGGGAVTLTYLYSYKNKFGDDGLPAILQYRPPDLYLTDRKETMAILQKDTHTPLHTCK